MTIQRRQLFKHNYVCGFVFSCFEGEENVLLIRKHNPPWQRGRFNGIGGKIETGETPHTAMLREFVEETGAGAQYWAERAPIIFTHFCTLSKGWDWRVHFFRAFTRCSLFEIENYTRPLDEPCSVFPARRLPVACIGNLRWLIPMALDQALRTPTEMIEQ